MCLRCWGTLPLDEGEEHMKIFKKRVNKEKVINHLMDENKALRKQNAKLVDLCNEKDSFFKEMISDGLRHGSPKAAKHMADRRDFLRKK